MDVPASSVRRPDRLTLAWILLLTAVVAAFAVAIAGLPSRDSATFVYIADGLLQGEAPYVDRWDHKAPLIYLIDAAGRLATPGSMLGIRALELLSLVAWSALGVAAIRGGFGRNAAFFGVAIAATMAIVLVEGGNMTEEWALLPQFLSLYLFVRLAATAADHPAVRWLPLAIGALGAMAFLLRPNLVGIWLAIGLVWLVWDPQRWRHLAWAVAGGLGTLGIAGAVLWLSGIGPEFVEATFVYNAAYTSVGGLGDQLERLLSVWASIPLAVPATLLWRGAAVIAVRPGDRPVPMVRLLRLAAIAWPIEVLLAGVAGRDFLHYLLAVLPSMTILLAFGGGLVVRAGDALIDRRAGTDDDRPRRLAGVLPPALVPWLLALLWLVLMAYPPVFGANDPLGLFGDRQDAEGDRWHRAATLLQQLTEPGDPVLVWGSEPQIYLLAEREAPSRFFYQFALATDAYADDELAREFIADLAADPPRVIIDTRHWWVPPIDRAARAAWEPLDPGYTGMPPAMDEFFATVERDYRPGPAVGSWPTYVLDGDG